MSEQQQQDQNNNQQQQQQNNQQQNSQQQSNQPWHASHGFDADTSKFINDHGFTDLKVMAKSHMEADRLARSRNVFEKPDPKALADWKGWSELGYAEKLEDYKVNKPEVKQGQHFDESFFNTLVKSAHGAKVPAWQAEKIASDIQTAFTTQLDAFNAEAARASQELEQGLRTAWGKDYDANKTLASRALKHFAVDALTSSQIEEMMGAPQMTKLFHAIGAAMGEDKLTGAGAGGGFGGKTPAQAEAELNRLQADQQWMAIFNDPRHPSNAAYREQRQQLINIMAAGNKAA